MKYVFFGTPEFAKIVLKHLIEANYIPSIVVCNPDRPVGRKKVITPPAVKQYIEELPENIKNQITILQPEKLGDIFDELEVVNADVFIVAAYAKIISDKILNLPKHGTIGVHPSLLPKLRGASPIQSAILFGEHKTGVTLYKVDKDVDHGPILSLEMLDGVDLGTISTPELHDLLAELGGRMLAKQMNALACGEVIFTEQEHAEATFTKKFATLDGFIEYQDIQRAIQGDLTLAKKIHAHVRALNPEPGVYTIMADGKRMKILKTALSTGLKLSRIQVEGGVPQDL